MQKGVLASVIMGGAVGFVLAQMVPLSWKDKNMNKVMEGYVYVKSAQEAAALFPKTIADMQERSKKAQQQARVLLDEIIACSTDKQTKETMLRVYDGACAIIARMNSVLFVLQSLSPDEKIREIAEKEIVVLSAFITENIECNFALYEAFKRYVEGNAKNELFTKTEKHFLFKIMRDFRLVGLHLSSKERDQVIVLKKEIAVLSVAFESNISGDITKIFVQKKDLLGLQEEWIEQLPVDEHGFVILSMDYPTRDIILRNCTVEETRKKYYRAFCNIAYPANAIVFKNLQTKRHELAQILGFPTYAAYNLASLMVKTPERAWAFENDLHERISKRVSEDVALLKKLLPKDVSLRSDGTFNKWDIVYVIETIKKEHYAIDEQLFAEYFPLQKTLEKLFKIYEQFFDLIITEVQVTDMWHQDVKLLTVKKKASGVVLGYIFLDLFPREKKYNHACHSTISQGFIAQDETVFPSVSVLICNFTKPTAEKESLLRYGEVKTFFHEFGHALHAILGATSYSDLSGTNTEQDFVELPSQLLENWIKDPVILKMIGSHYKTGEPLSDELIQKRMNLLSFCRGIDIAAQLYFGMLSLSCFGEEWNQDIDSLDKNCFEKNQTFLSYDSETHFYCSFGHLTGYGAAYYGYMWSLVFSDDIFEQIKKEGLLNPQAGERYCKAIIGRGGSVDANTMLLDYLGRIPSSEAFYKKLGI